VFVTYLFVIESFGAGGAERSLVELLPRLSASGIRVVVACLYRREVGFEEEALQAGAEVRFLSGKGRWGRIRSLRHLVGEIDPDLVYTSLFEADLVGRLATIGLPVPVMCNLANTAYDPARLADPNVSKWRLQVVRLVDRVLGRFRTHHFHAVSQAVKDSTVATLGIPPEKITVVYRGRDLQRIGERSPQRRRQVRQRLAIDEATEMVVTVGRQEYQKGHIHLVGAFARVVADRPKARLYIVGRDGHMSGAIRQRITQLGLESAVFLLGHRADVTDIVAAADLFVFPSLYEGLGGALLEALALGMPVVVSDIPALREVVEAGGNGDLVAPGDEDGLAQAISGLLADPERRERYGRRSFEIFAERFDADENAQRFVELLAAVARRH
jgi:glycosyltransferase involved in cell wall biosynthesis